MSDMYGKCRSCDRVFLVAKLPMELAKVARLMKRASCPACGETKGIRVANAADVALAEAQAVQR